MIRACGFDTSYWNHGQADNQKPIDFQQAFDAGYSFWIGRLTRGQNYIDTWIERDYQTASQTPLHKGIYHVLYPGEPVTPHIANLRKGLALLPEPPKAIALDLERGAEFGAIAVTACLVETVRQVNEFWTGKLLLYSNLNYLRNLILDTCGLDIWVSWPAEGGAYNPIDNPPIECVIYQRSYRQSIPGLPDATIDHDEFMGDEMQCFQYFNAFEPPNPEPPEEEMDIALIKQKLGESIAKLSDVISTLDWIAGELVEQPQPPQPPTPPPPTPAPTTKLFQITAEKSLANYTQRLNESGRPIMAIYEPRIRYNTNDKVNVYPTIVQADGGSRWYEMALRGTGGIKLYLEKADGVLL